MRNFLFSDVSYCSELLEHENWKTENFKRIEKELIDNISENPSFMGKMVNRKEGGNEMRCNTFMDLNSKEYYLILNQ